MSSAGEAAAGPQRSVRTRLLTIALVPMLIVLPLLLGIGLLRWSGTLDTLKIAKVSDDLTIARQYLLKLSGDVEASLDAAGASYRFHQLLVARDSAGLSGFLGDIAREHGFDFIYLLDAGKRLVAGSGIGQDAGTGTVWPDLRDKLAGGEGVGIDVFSAGELAAISPELAGRARIDITAPARKGEVETRGLVLHAASPVNMPGGEGALVVAGILLNNNLAFVDAINDLIYHGPRVIEGSRGTVTLFLDDIRISTNAGLFKGKRAIGTSVSAEVRQSVLGEGKTWLDSAKVLDERFVSAYEPLTDTGGRRVGMLYVGFLERPISEAKLETLVWTLAALAVAVAITVPLFLLWAARIFKPLEQMDAVVARVEAGDVTARTGIGAPMDEVGRAAAKLDQLLDRVAAREKDLRALNRQLGILAEERAVALREKTGQLETTIEQLVMSEKLATIGEITASIAHEVNNPVAIMQGNLELVRTLLGSEADKVETELGLLDQQMRRMTEIIGRLLLLARPHEYAVNAVISPSETIGETMPFVRHLLSRGKVDLQREDGARHMIRANRVELQQVLVNLIVNAVHAMPEGGRLWLRTRDEDRNGVAGVALDVTDTGIGMEPAMMARIFEPFFTTKVRDGNGLGLSISRMLVTRQGGELSVASAWGEGSTFTIWLPSAG